MKKVWFCSCFFVMLLAVLSSGLNAQELPAKRNVRPPDAGLNAPGTKLIDIILSGDRQVLKSKDEMQVAALLKDRNSKIIDYLVAKYPQYGVPEIDVNDPAATWFGLICAMYEGVNFKPLKDIKFSNLSFDTQIPTWLSCTVGILGASSGITEIISSLGTFSYGSVWKVVKFVVKKYVTGWVGTAIALYEIANECF